MEDITVDITRQGLDNADVNHDNLLNAYDAVLILRYIAQLIDTFVSLYQSYLHNQRWEYEIPPSIQYRPDDWKLIPFRRPLLKKLSETLAQHF